MELEESEYINQGPCQQRCNFTFLVDEQVNLVEKMGSIRVFSTRGKKCGLERDANSTQGYCYWHETNPDKAQDPGLRERLEAAVQHKVYLGGVFLSGGGPGTHYRDSAGPLDLSGANLQGVFLAGAYLEGTILNGANLREANLMSAWFGSADLSGADLTGAHIQNTDLEYSSMEGAELWKAEINSGTRLDGIYWGADYVLATERGGRFDCAATVYRILKQHSRDSGDYRTAGEFYFREMECLRKQRQGEKAPSSIPKISSRDLYADGGTGLRYNVVIDYMRAANASLSHESPGVFLCHSSSDKPFIRELAMALVKNGVKVWIDEAEISIGESLTGKIESGISGSKYLIAVLSNNSINSQWCAEELGIAMADQLAQKGIVVLPVLIEECEIPSFLQGKRYADFRKADDFDRAVAELCAAIQ
ncbi:MAG TPA: toll/interleukin-1 receptor domain-containing protein [Pyrinomonadaceae bacterium]|nr:toll/interleukin-1 receptor domain-containing protein [Pyrinomonadaceae bacterium]